MKSDNDTMVICSLLKNENFVNIFVGHEVNKTYEVTNVTHVRDSGVSSNGSGGLGMESSFFKEVATSEGISETTDEYFIPFVEPLFSVVEPYNPTSEPQINLFATGADKDGAETSSDYELEELFEKGDIDYSNDIHEENRAFREVGRTFKRSRKRKRTSNVRQVPTGKNGADIGDDKTTAGNKNSIDGKVGCDEPYYLSDVAGSFEKDDENDEENEEEVEQVVSKPPRKNNVNRVVFLSFL